MPKRHKQHKIKHYYQRGEGTFRAKPHPLTIIFSVAALAVLVFVGVSIYQPIFDYIMGIERAGLPPASSQQEPISSSSPPAPASPVPEPAPEPAPNHEPLRGVYAPQAIVDDGDAFDRFLDGLAGTGINAVMLDIKNAQGQLLFASQNADAQKWGAIVPGAPDLGQLAQKLEERSLSLIVREWTFRDELAARGNRANAIHYAGGGEMLWLDDTVRAGGKPWLNPYSRGAQDYIAAIALEAVEAGAKLVVLESVQFPDGSNVGNTNFGTSENSIGRSQVLSAFVADIAAAVEEKGARLGVYYPVAAMTQAQSEVRYGGSPLLIADGLLLLGVLPQQFAGDYSAGGLEIVQPLQNPAAAVKAALEFTDKSLADAGKKTSLLPLLQGGSEPAVDGMSYSAAQIAAQIAAASDFGLEEYILYQTGGAYILS